MGYKVVDAVRLKPRSEYAPLLAEGADLTGKVADAWTDNRGERLHVICEGVGLYVPDLPAAEFVADRPLVDAPF